ncbi:hypothetical protein EB118_05315 [bacterium]|nr:hypothetical protein [bacterium]NDC93755.1 hypothetical protein [bacterium]NDD83088.1 hypothetical protein [bacterium]NDG29503.1 hypothetical protein [bacterium]
MSYSYLKNVFPNYVSSVDYEDYIFRSLNAIDAAEESAKKLDTPPNVVTDRVISNYAKAPQPLEVQPADPQSQLNQFTQSLLAHPVSLEKGTYVHQPTEPIHPVLRRVETFQNTDCGNMCKHVLDCSRCKNVLIKQWDLDKDRLRNEEIMEVITYIIFGLFLVTLIHR